MKDISNAPGRDISRLGGFIRKQLDEIASRNGMTQAQGRTLQYIAGQRGPVYQKDIEEEYGLRPATASQMLQAMEDEGLILREVDENDRRKKKIIVAPGRREAAERMTEQIGEMEDMLIEGIEEEKLAVFYEVMDRMYRNIPRDKH